MLLLTVYCIFNWTVYKEPGTYTGSISWSREGRGYSSSILDLQGVGSLTVHHSLYIWVIVNGGYSVSWAFGIAVLLLRPGRISRYADLAIWSLSCLLWSPYYRLTCWVWRRFRCWLRMLVPYGGSVWWSSSTTVCWLYSRAEPPVLHNRGETPP